MRKFDLSVLEQNNWYENDIGDLISDFTDVFQDNLEMQLYRHIGILDSSNYMPYECDDLDEWLKLNCNSESNGGLYDYLIELSDNEDGSLDSIKDDFLATLAKVNKKELKETFNKETIDAIKTSSNYKEFMEKFELIDEDNDSDFFELQFEYFDNTMKKVLNNYFNGQRIDDKFKHFEDIIIANKNYFEQYYTIDCLCVDNVISYLINKPINEIEIANENLDFDLKDSIKSYIERYGNNKFPIDLYEEFKIKDENIPLIVDMIKAFYNEEVTNYTNINQLAYGDFVAKEQIEFLIEYNYLDEAKHCLSMLSDEFKNKLDKEFIEKINNLDSNERER